MLKKTKAGFFTLSSLPISTAVSTVAHGDMRRKNPGSLQRFSREVGIRKIIRAEQVHRTSVTIVSNDDVGKEIKGADALVTTDFDLGLVVVTADCLPVFAYDPKKHLIGIAHAGWKGTLNLMAEKLVKSFIDLGSKPSDLFAGIGPCIEFCHYEVGPEVAKKFRKAGFGKSILTSISGKLYLDLKQVNFSQLERVGVRKSNIDFSVKSCTYESKEFYSFRRDRSVGKELSGEFASIIFQKKA